ncbi:MAG: dipeptide/oligopeptide/nickel ABC transporter ATP-binding protein [Fervidobacterium sp.]|uniref:Peptide/nickel transport system ATP-binding protein n=1 Tax=Fervidobacterium gondwanense DSM 13020 TaxID=1121883 RepID=A0A1M7T0G7_FERGO|nr:dipeptide/oligopeptide/nickel ABC transporter ATP-binding protein [Fervidobacterium gondwanense]UXF01119.1 peptide ABC transporter ATPase [Fervidobacterium riparium]SHN64265.1 peptide/nickel transport system ATP-binding protein [Fervidobacterium gondwanense DSM 13020]
MSRLVVENLTKTFSLGFIAKRHVNAVKSVSFTVKEKEIVSLVGESGSGKTTTAKMLLRLIQPTSGKIMFEGKDIWKDLKTQEDFKTFRRKVHAVFQDPFASYNPFYPVERPLWQAINLLEKKPSNKKEALEIIKDSLFKVGIDPKDILGKYPHQVSGGQKQRIMIARCWILRPLMIVADEPTSMIDASSRGGIIQLFEKLRDEQGTSIIFITHDLGLAYYVSDNIFVMKDGEIVDRGHPDKVVLEPQHEYSKLLVESIPKLYRKLEGL